MENAKAAAALHRKQENKQLLGWHNEPWKEREKNLHNASPL